MSTQTKSAFEMSLRLPPSPPPSNFLSPVIRLRTQSRLHSPRFWRTWIGRVGFVDQQAQSPYSSFYLLSFIFPFPSLSVLHPFSVHKLDEFSSIATNIPRTNNRTSSSLQPLPCSPQHYPFIQTLERPLMFRQCQRCMRFFSSSCTSFFRYT